MAQRVQMTCRLSAFLKHQVSELTNANTHNNATINTGHSEKERSDKCPYPVQYLSPN